MNDIKALGKHILLELYDCPQVMMSDTQALEDHLCQAAEVMGATLVDKRFHQFSPYGVSGVVIIQESHLTIHTWPEYAYAAIDIFTCGEIDLEAGVEYLKKALQSGRSACQQIERGLDLKFKEVVPGE
jgi:S-adenosylmethionine decarboxylase proenzyme